MAVSSSAIEESTFIWNPNLIALSSAIALAAAWQAWTSGRPRWWLLAGIGLAVTMQCHVLGVTMLPIIAALLVADARRRSPGVERRSVWRFGLGALAIVVVSFLPLVIHELTTDFAEVHAALDYLRAGGEPPMLGPIGRFLVIGGRVVSWPLTALMTDAPLAALIATIVVIAIAVWCGIFGRDREREAARWLGLGLLWTALALTFISPSLATVIPGLPNDHYHAFADPMVFTLLGMGVAVLWRAGVAERRVGIAERPAGVAERRAAGAGGRRSRPVTVGRVVAVVGVAALVAFDLADRPPAVHPDGGFPAAEVAAARIIQRGRSRSADPALAPRLQVDRGLWLPAGACRGDRSRRHGQRPGHRGRRLARHHLRCPVRDGDRGAVRRSGGGGHRTIGSVRSAGRPVPGRPRTDDLDLPPDPVAGEPSQAPVAAAVESRRPTPQTSAFAVPETRTVEGESGSCPGVC